MVNLGCVAAANIFAKGVICLKQLPKVWYFGLVKSPWGGGWSDMWTRQKTRTKYPRAFSETRRYGRRKKKKKTSKRKTTVAAPV